MEAGKKVVYICSKYRGDIETNTQMARRYSRYAIDRGCVPLTPHLLLPQFVSEETERETALEAGIALLSRCDEIWVCGSEVSEGMAAEIAWAEDRNMDIVFITEGDLTCTRSEKE